MACQPPLPLNEEDGDDPTRAPAYTPNIQTIFKGTQPRSIQNGYNNQLIHHTTFSQPQPTIFIQTCQPPLLNSNNISQNNQLSQHSSSPVRIDTDCPFRPDWSQPNALQAIEHQHLQYQQRPILQPPLPYTNKNSMQSGSSNNINQHVDQTTIRPQRLPILASHLASTPYSQATGPHLMSRPATGVTLQPIQQTNQSNLYQYQAPQDIAFQNPRPPQPFYAVPNPNPILPTRAHLPKRVYIRRSQQAVTTLPRPIRPQQVPLPSQPQQNPVNLSTIPAQLPRLPQLQEQPRAQHPPTPISLTLLQQLNDQTMIQNIDMLNYGPSSSASTTVAVSTNTPIVSTALNTLSSRSSVTPIATPSATLPAPAATMPASTATSSATSTAIANQGQQTPVSVSSTTLPPDHLLPNQVEKFNKACQVDIKQKVQMISRGVAANTAPESNDASCQTDPPEEPEAKVVVQKQYVDRACSPVFSMLQVKLKKTPKRRKYTDHRSDSSDGEINVIE